MTGEGKQGEKRGWGGGGGGGGWGGWGGGGGKKRSFFRLLPVKINLTNY